MPEMATEAALDAVAQLFEAYKQEHKTSTLTLPQFRQVRAPWRGPAPLFLARTPEVTGRTGNGSPPADLCDAPAAKGGKGCVAR